jgi:hypothetical protein
MEWRGGNLAPLVPVGKREEEQGVGFDPACGPGGGRGEGEGLQLRSRISVYENLAQNLAIL